MRIPRIYQQDALVTGTQLPLAKEAAHHVVNVLRMKTGQSVVLFNGDGREYEAVLVRVNRRQVEVELGRGREVNVESPLHITLAQGISRGNRMDLTLQKAVELGVNRIVPVLTQFGNVRLDKSKQEKRLEHWRRVVIAACEQCGRAHLPELEVPLSLPDWLQADNNRVKLVLHPLAAQSFSDVPETPLHLTLLAGPEGGFSDAEYELAREHGYCGVRLGPRILRTETAAIAALVACQAAWGDLCRR